MTAGVLRVGFGRREITPPLGAPLAGVVSRRGRPCTRIRDSLFVRAIHLERDGSVAVVIAVDLLLITRALHRQVAQVLGLEPRQLLLSATHSHSAPGGYWDLERGRLFMGTYRQATFDGLVEAIVTAVREARGDARAAETSAATVSLAGVSANRRRLHGPVDPELSLLHFDRAGARSIDLLSFGAHPVIGCVREPGVCSADFPGEVCRRIEARGRLPLFFTGAVGGLSPLFPEFPLPLDPHLELLGDLLERGIERAEAALAPVAVGSLEADLLELPTQMSCELFPRRLGFALAERLATPVHHFMMDMARDARESETAPLHVVRLGEVALVGAPCDLGVTVALALKRVLREHGVRLPLVGSHSGGYVGYVHLPEDYDHVPEPGFRSMAYYENAMSLSGRQLGRDMVEALQRRLRGS